MDTVDNWHIEVSTKHYFDFIRFCKEARFPIKVSMMWKSTKFNEEDLINKLKQERE